jgi:TonB family protein
LRADKLTIMLKPLFIALLAIAIFQNTFAQNPQHGDTLIYYFKDGGRSTVKDSAAYSLYIMPKNPASKNGLYPVIEYYKNGKQKLVIASSVQSLNMILEGPGTSFSPNGHKSKTMIYKGGKPVGVITEYYPNGKIYTIQKIDDFGGLKDIECRDSSGTVLAKNGEGKWIDFDADFKFALKETILENGSPGKWYPIMDTSLYADFEKQGSVLLDPVTKPFYPLNAKRLQRLLQSNLLLVDKYIKDKKKDSLSAVISISMIVEKNGLLTHLKVVKSNDDYFAQEALRLVGLSAPWVSGSASANGPPARTQTTITLRFSIHTITTSFNYQNSVVDVEIVNMDEEYNNTGPVFSTTEITKQPEYIKGKEALYAYIGNNLIYPASDRIKKISGKVFVQFVVEKDGYVSNVKTLRGPSQSLNDETERLIRSADKWIPGSKNDTTVRVKYIMPITFSLPIDTVKLSDKDEEYNKTGEILSKAEEPPVFPGGLNAFTKFLYARSNYPFAERKAEVHGRVIIQFVVEKDGCLSNMYAIRGPSQQLVNEVIRVLKLSPKWIPGKLAGMPVRVSYAIPVNFSLVQDNNNR